jgi:hypothetical protein
MLTTVKVMQHHQNTIKNFYPPKTFSTGDYSPPKKAGANLRKTRTPTHIHFVASVCELVKVC